MNYELIKVEARYFMLGCRRKAAKIRLFIVFINFIWAALAAVFAVEFRKLWQTVGGRVALGASAVAVVLLFMLHACVVLISDRWLMSATHGERVPVMKLYQRFSFHDFLTACSLQLNSLLRKAIRFLMFMLIPVLMFSATLAFASRGISLQVFYVLSIGSALCAAVGLFFALVANCGVGLARMLCCEGNMKIKDSLRRFDESCLEIAKFSFSMGVLNWGYRSQAKLLLALALLNRAERSAFQPYRRRIHA